MRPSVDRWLQEAREDPGAAQCGMYLIHNGIVRETSRATVRFGDETAPPVTGMRFDYDEEKVRRAADETRAMPGIGFVRVWLNRGELKVGEDIMYVLIGGDIRPHVADALQFLVGKIKNECVQETELY